MRWEKRIARVISRGVQAIFGGEEGRDVPADGGFRRPNDPENVLRFKPARPAGVSRKLAEFVPVRGVSKGEQAIYAEEFMCNSKRELELVRDPSNPFSTDGSAIKVIGRWKTKGGASVSRQLGWVPSEVAKEIKRDAPKERLAATLVTIYIPTDEKSLGLRMDIWAPRKTKRKQSVVDDEPDVYVID